MTRLHDILYSFKGELNGKESDFSFYLQGVGKANGYLSEEARHCFINDYSVPKKSHLDRWTPENPNASYPRMYYAQTHNRRFSDFWIENAAYLRLKNVQLGYTFPQKWMRKFGINRLRAYVSPIICLPSPNISTASTPKFNNLPEILIHR